MQQYKVPVEARSHGNAMQVPAEADSARQQLATVQRSQRGLRVIHLKPARLCLAGMMFMQTCECKHFAETLFLLLP